MKDPAQPNRLSCEQACSASEKCDGFIMKISNSATTCDFYTLDNRDTCPNCGSAAYSCTLPEKANQSLWVYKKSLCSDAAPPAKAS